MVEFEQGKGDKPVIHEGKSDKILKTIIHEGHEGRKFRARSCWIFFKNKEFL